MCNHPYFASKISREEYRRRGIRPLYSFECVLRTKVSRLKVINLASFCFSCRRIVERSTRRTWEQPASVSYLPSDLERDLKNGPERLKYLDTKESTRRFR